MSHQNTGYEYVAILRADESLKERIRVQNTLFNPLLREREQCQATIDQLVEDSAAERIRYQEMLHEMQVEKLLAETEERRAELTDEMVEQREFGDAVQGYLEQKMRDKRNRSYAIELQLQELGRSHPQSVADLQDYRMRLEAYYYPTELPPHSQASKMEKKKKKKKKKPKRT